MGLKETVATLKEVVRSTSAAKNVSQEPSPTQMFALISTVLPSSTKNASYCCDLLRILVGIMDSTSTALIQQQFKTLSKTLLLIITNEKNTVYNEDNETNLLYLSIQTQCLLLKYQDTSDSFWNSQEVFQVINVLLSFVDCHSIKIRKEIHLRLSELLMMHRTKSEANKSQLNGKVGSFRSYFADFCTGVIKMCTRSDYNRAFCTVSEFNISDYKFKFSY